MDPGGWVSSSLDSHFCFLMVFYSLSTNSTYPVKQMPSNYTNMSSLLQSSFAILVTSRLSKPLVQRYNLACSSFFPVILHGKLLSRLFKNIWLVITLMFLFIITWPTPAMCFHISAHGPHLILITAFQLSISHQLLPSFQWFFNPVLNSNQLTWPVFLSLPSHLYFLSYSTNITWFC